jgi:periplasmic divalent cation tolerance protein
MVENDKPILLYATAPSLEVGEAIAAALVDARLAACVNLIPGMVSIYVWDGARQRDSEVVMIVKTRAGLAAEAEAAIAARHPYATPAILRLAVDGGANAFVAWINAQTTA